MEDEHVLQEFHRVCEQGDVRVVHEVILRCQSIATLKALLAKSTSSNTTALHVAARFDRADVISLMLKKAVSLCVGREHTFRAIVETQDEFGLTAVDVAKEERSHAALAALEAFGCASSSKHTADIFAVFNRHGWLRRLRHSFLDCTFYLPYGSFLLSLLFAGGYSLLFALDTQPSFGYVHWANMVSQAVVWAAFVLVKAVNPGTLPPPDDTDSDAMPSLDAYLTALEQFEQQVSKGRASSSASYLCHICRQRRPLRAGHSVVANRCIPVYDHFCSFLLSDIGRDNYRYFMAFLLCMSLLAMPQYLRLAGQYLRRHQDDADYDTSLTIIGCKGFTIWTFFIWLFITYQLIFHCYLWVRGLTSREFRGGPDRFPYINQPELRERATTTYCYM